MRFCRFDRRTEFLVSPLRCMKCGMNIDDPDMKVVTYLAFDELEGNPVVCARCVAMGIVPSLERNRYQWKDELKKKEN